MEKESKKLGLFDIFCLGVGGTIGSGIFVLLGSGIAYTGHSVFLAVIVGCVYMTFAYLFQPVMSSLFVLPGGDYDMKAMLFGPTLTGVGAIFTYIMGMELGVYATAMVDYAGMVFPGIVPYSRLVAVLIVTLFFACTIKGSKFVSMVTSAMTIVLFAAIILFVLFGIPRVQSGFFDGDTFFLNGGIGFIQAIAIMGYACQGTTMVPVAMMEVTKKPRWTVPMGIVFITIAVGVLYGLISYVAAGVLPVEVVADQNLALVANEIFPYGLYVVFIIGGAVFAIGSSLIGTIAMLRYPCYQVAEDGWVPAVFKKTTKGGYPYVVQGFFYLIGILPIIMGVSLSTAVSWIMIPNMLMNVCLNISLISMVKKYPKQWKTSVFHMPMAAFSVLCVLGAVFAAVVAWNLFLELSTIDMIGCIIILALCVGIAVVRLNTGAVDKSALIKKKEEIAARALKSTADLDE